MNESSDAGTPLSDPLSQNDNRKGKTRTSINARQLEILQATYDKETRPSRPMREEIAAQTGLSAKVIQVWFQNRRSKDKKDTSKGDPLMPPPKTELWYVHVPVLVLGYMYVHVLVLLIHVCTCTLY